MEQSRELSTDEVFIKTLSDTVFDNLRNEQFGVEEMARQVGFSRSQIHRKLQRITGKSLTQFIREIRLKEAYKLLVKDTGTAAEISYLVGFNSPTYFNTSFHEFFGFPPGEIKKRKKEEISIGDDDNGKPPKEIDFLLSNRAKLQVSKLKSKRKNRIIWVGAISTIAMIVIALLLFNKISDLSLIGSSEKVITQHNKSVALLPFDHIESEEGNHFAHGVMQDIQYNLSMIGGLRVIPKTSMERFNESNLSVKQIAWELDVDYLLEGYVQKRQNKVKIHVSLIKGKSEEIIWTSVYERNMDDYFSIQSEIATEIAHALYVTISPEELERIQYIPTQSQTAHSFFIKARDEHIHFWVYDDSIHLSNAIKNYRIAIGHDPSFAKALAGIGLAYYNKLGHNNLDDKQSPYWDSIFLYAQKSIIANNKLGEAHLINGLYAYGKQGKTEQAINEIDLALKYDPNNYMAYQQKGFLLGRVKSNAYEAIINLTEASQRIRGKELAPLYGALARFYGDMGFFDESKKYLKLEHNIVGNQSEYYEKLGFLEFSKGNYATAIEHYEKSVAWDTSKFISPVFLIASGQIEKAYIESQKYLELTNENPWIADFHRIGYSFWEMGDQKQGLHYFNKQIEKCQKTIKENSHFAIRKYAYYDLAATYAFLDDKEKAIRALNELKSNHTYSVYALNFLKSDDPLFDNIRKDPRFQEIVNHVEERHLKEHEGIKDWLLDQKTYTDR